MSEIIQFPQKPRADRILWRCNCGCITSYLHHDGSAECAACGETVKLGEWRKSLPETPANPPELSPGDRIITDLNDPSIALKYMVNKADPSTMSAVVILHSDGRLRVWSEEAGTSERKAWFERRMAEATKLIVKGDDE